MGVRERKGEWVVGIYVCVFEREIFVFIVFKLKSPLRVFH